MTQRGFRERYYLTEAGILRRLWRDVRYLGYVASVIWAWLIVGGRVRREYERCRRNGDTYWVDHLDGKDI